MIQIDFVVIMARYNRLYPDDISPLLDMHKDVVPVDRIKKLIFQVIILCIDIESLRKYIASMQDTLVGCQLQPILFLEKGIC